MNRLMNQMKRGKLCLAASLAFLTALGGCSRTKVESAPEPPPVPVMVAPVAQKDLPIIAESIGTGEAYSNVQIKPLVSGTLTGIFFKEGDFIKKGQLLFTIDPKPFQTALDQTLGTLAKDSAQENIDGVTAARYQKLYEEGIVPKQQYDQYASQSESSKALVQADEAAVEAARLQLSYCKIYSPMDGKTGALGVFVGNLVKANDVPVLVTINQISPIYVDFAVPETLLPQVRTALETHAPVQAYTQGDTTHAETGHLSFLDNSVDATTGTIKLKGTFDNAGRKLWPGEFVTVKLELGQTPNAVVVPSVALQTSQQGSYVWVVQSDNTVQMRLVKVTRQSEGEALIASGLKPGERVVTEGQLRLVPGSRVDIRQGL